MGFAPEVFGLFDFTFPDVDHTHKAAQPGEHFKFDGDETVAVYERFTRKSHAGDCIYIFWAGHDGAVIKTLFHGFDSERDCRAAFGVRVEARRVIGMVKKQN